MKRLLALCLVLVACEEEKIVTVTEYLTVVPEPLSVSYTVDVLQVEHAGSNLWYAYQYGHVTNENDVACYIVPGLEISVEGDSILTDRGVIGHGQNWINGGLIDTVLYLAARDTATYYVKTRQFVDGRDAIVQTVFQVTDTTTN